MKLDLIKEEIIKHINAGNSLEALYRKDTNLFQRAFNDVYQDIKGSETAMVWHERLNFKGEGISIRKKDDFIFISLLSIVSGIIANVPNFFSLIPDDFFQKNIGFVVFPILMVFFLRKQPFSIKNILFPVISILLSALFINLFPNSIASDTFILACIHLPIFLWAVLGYVFIEGDLSFYQMKIDFLRYNGNLVVMTAILLLSGALFSGITIGLFSLIGFDIIEFYMEHIAIWGLAAIPVVASYLVQHNPQLVNNISPVIARIFTPIVFITLLVFSSAMMFAKENIYHDRNFLIIFNALLLGVMAIILFSATETSRSIDKKINYLFLFGISMLTIILNGIALSAILFRLTEFGITPNRVAVLGTNLLVFINLLLVAHKLFLVIKGRADVQKVEHAITLFIPLFGIWAAFVTFILPLLFCFK